MARDHTDCVPCRLRLREAQRNGDRVEWGQAVSPAPVFVAIWPPSTAAASLAAV